MQADETAADEAPHGKTPRPQTIIIGIADHETGEDEKEVDSEIAVVDAPDGRRVATREGKALEDMIDEHQKGCRTAQTIEDEIVGTTVGKRSRQGGNGLRHTIIKGR